MSGGRAREQEKETETRVKTLRGLVEGHLDPDASKWDLKGGWHVLGTPWDAPHTADVMRFLEEVLPGFEASCSRGFGADDVYDIQAPFLDGGFFARTQDTSISDLLSNFGLTHAPREEKEALISEFYAGLSTFAYIEGPRALLFIALGMGLKVPREFFAIHGLEGLTLEALDRDLGFDRAYRATTYAADARGRGVAIRIGKSGAEACLALGLEEGEGWAYITAWNPGSEKRSRAENEGAQENLRESLRAGSYPFLEGMSEPDDGREGEGSLLVAIPEERAIELGRAFGQKAIVVGRRSDAYRQDEARLVWL